MNARLENRVLNFFHEYLYTVTKVTIRNSTSKTKLKNPLCTSILQGMLGNISIFFAPKLFNAFWEFCGKLFFAYIIIRVLPENSQTFPVINKQKYFNTMIYYICSTSLQRLLARFQYHHIVVVICKLAISIVFVLLVNYK